MDKKFRKRILTNKEFNTIINYFNVVEVTLILFDINKDFRDKIINVTKIDKNNLNECIKLLSRNLTSLEDIKKLSHNHMENISLLEDLIKSNKEINIFTLYKSIPIILLNLFKNLTAIDLQKNNMGFRGVLLLQMLIQRTKFLLQLNLSFNNLCDEGFNYLSNSLKINQTIEVLNLECNNITDEGFSYFLNLSTFPIKLKIVKLSLNLITENGLNLLNNILSKENILLLIFDLRYNNFKIDMANQLLLEKNQIYT